MFSDRLDFIMALTNTTCSALGRASMLDPSYISRLRKGERPLPGKPLFLREMQHYLAHRMHTEYQRRSMADVIGLAEWPSDEAAAAECIGAWLSEGRQAGQILNPRSIYRMPARKLSDAFWVDSKDVSSPSSEQRFYYGPKGKRLAVLRFLRQVLDIDNPQTLLLASDEDMSWLYDDKSFASEWQMTFQNVLQAGHRVRIIHTMNRDMHDLHEAITRWIPLYATGMIDSFHYPRLRDGLMQRTLFVAPGIAAVTSTSISHQTEGMLNEYVVESTAVEALEIEYRRYEALCRPLMEMVSPAESDRLWSMCVSMFDGVGDIGSISAVPTIATMPQEVADMLQHRAPGSRIRPIRDRFADGLKRFLAKGRFIETVGKQENCHRAPVPFAEFLGAPGLRYTYEELQLHYEYLEQLSRKSGNFTSAVRDDIPANAILFSQDEGAAVVCTLGDADRAFAISQATMAKTLWNYVSNSVP